MSWLVLVWVSPYKLRGEVETNRHRNGCRIDRHSRKLGAARSSSQGFGDPRCRRLKQAHGKRNRGEHCIHQAITSHAFSHGRICGAGMGRDNAERTRNNLRRC
ncbi:hypothetical protein LZ32DRAFT_64427 [Colletotrichum eremochloae]|nr:hypothetical protein LZ32DRAFT_64427 [Colletotrichum eremochloae]